MNSLNSSFNGNQLINSINGNQITAFFNGNRITGFFKKHYKAIAIAIAVFSIILTIGYFFNESLAHFKVWLKSNLIFGSFVFVLLQGIAACILLPVTAFGIVAGAVFPLPLAVFLTLIGNQVGILMAYILASSLLRKWVQELSLRDPRAHAIERALHQDGFKLIVLLRLTPVFPFGLINYLLSGSGIPLLIICFASLLGNFPNTIIQASVGSLAGDTDHEMAPKLKHLTILLTCCFAAGSSIFITLVAKRALRSVVDLDTPVAEVAELEQGGGSSIASPTSDVYPASATTSDAYPTSATSAAASDTSNDEQRLLISRPSNDEQRLLIGASPRSQPKKEQKFTRGETLLMQATFSIIFILLVVGIPLIWVLE